MRQHFKSITGLFAFLLFFTSQVFANTYKPFILGASQTGSLIDVKTQAEDALKKQGFSIVGEYSPKPGIEILVVTNDALKNLAKGSKNGGFGAMQRVAITEASGGVEVTYTNPTYQFHVYRMKGDISPVQSAMEGALGNQTSFGAEAGLSESELREYHYKFMMPYFDDVDELASYDSYQQATETIASGLAAKKGGASQVYRIDMPDSKMSVFGVAFSQTEGADDNILNQIDKGQHSHAAHLCYEILVVDDEAIALNGKFRIAISWPSLSMMGSGSFMSIANAPDEILATLEVVAEK